MNLVGLLRDVFYQILVICIILHAARVRIDISSVKVVIHLMTAATTKAITYNARSTPVLILGYTGQPCELMYL
jgi:hypothetical protein